MLWGNADLTVLPAEKGNTKVITNTNDYTWKTAHLEDPVHKILAKDHTGHGKENCISHQEVHSS